MRHAALCALGTACLVPAIALAAEQTDQPASDTPRPTLIPSNVRPDAALTATRSGDKVVFDASKSLDSDGRIVSYEWDLDGDSVYETKTQDVPRIEHTYEPGTTTIAAVRVTDDAGASDEATSAVVVPAASPEPPAATAPTPASSNETPLVTTNDLGSDNQPRSVKSSRESTTKSGGGKADPTLVAAASGAVTIRDFEFVQKTVTVNVGDSVTWTNQGPTTHTATAKDGSFDSGNLNKGGSFSHKFTKAGTFNYFCKPHPFMTAKIVVTGASSGGSGGSSSGSGSGSGSSGSGSSGSGSAGAAANSGSSSSSGGSLARTGVDLAPWALFGLSLFLFGASMRYRLTAE
jgi:plastocyanin